MLINTVVCSLNLTYLWFFLYTVDLEQHVLYADFKKKIQYSVLHICGCKGLTIAGLILRFSIGWGFGAPNPRTIQESTHYLKIHSICRGYWSLGYILSNLKGKERRLLKALAQKKLSEEIPKLSFLPYFKGSI